MIYSYVLRFDDGAAPNPFWGLCTLTICKPVIRRNAKEGDWVIGTGSKNAKLKDSKTHDLSRGIVYAMKITDIKLLSDYDKFCMSFQPDKIPKWRADDWRLRVGDCIYNYSTRSVPSIRKSVHNERNRKRDLSGINSLISNHFYYFGSDVKIIPEKLKNLIKKNQGHKKIENANLIMNFEEWINQFEKNKIYADPQMSWLFDREITEEELSNCAKQRFEEDEDESEELVC